MKKIFLFATALVFISKASYALGIETLMQSAMNPFVISGAIRELAADIVVLEVGGKLYYIDNLDELLSDDAKNTCVYSSVDGQIELLYNKLISACKQSLAQLSTSKKDLVGPTNIMLNLMAKIDKKTALSVCLLRKEMLEARKDNNTTTKVHISDSITSCVNSIKIHKDQNTCPITYSVPDEKYLDNLRNLDTAYFDEDFSFSTDYNGNGNLVGLFNGYMLLICDGSKPAYIVKPSFSGAYNCQGGNFSTIPNVGSLPSGVYLAKRSEVEKMETPDAGWGTYRIPLRPSLQNQSFGRGSFYLHGTTDEEKRSSGGCISLGTGITEFVENFYSGENRDLLIIVDLVPNVEQVWNSLQ